LVRIMRYVRLLAVAVLAVVLALSSAQDAFATVTLAYDNGIWNTYGGDGHDYAGVRFSVPDDASPALLRYVRWARSFDYPLEIHITGPDHVTELSGSPIILAGPTEPAGTGCPAGWQWCGGLDLTSQGWVVTGDFFVIFYRPGGSTLYEDTGVPLSGRLFVGWSLATLAVSTYEANGLIRVDIDPNAPAAPVGGIVIPANTFALVAPWLAVLGLLCIGTIAVVVRKRR